jgi:hypothetical protein
MMRAAISKSILESQLVSRFGDVVRRREKRLAELLSTGVPEIDSLTGGGLPRGAITEIFGRLSSGRTSLLLSVLAEMTRREEICALVDTGDAFAPTSAAHAGVDFGRLLWVRCAGSIERAFKATDLLLQSGGFGLVALDTADVPATYARRIISSWWFRFRRAIENTPTALLVIGQVSCVRSCASLILELGNEGANWSSVTEPNLAANGTSPLARTFDFPTPAECLSLVRNSPPPMPCDSSPTHSLLLHDARVRIELPRPFKLAERPAESSTCVNVYKSA